MILVDTSVWIDHLRSGDQRLAAVLIEGEVLCHPWIVGELALGHLARRTEVIALLGDLPKAKIATEAEIMDLIEVRRLFGVGIGYVDVHLLAAALLTPGTELWTRDERLAAAARDFGLASGTF